LQAKISNGKINIAGHVNNMKLKLTNGDIEINNNNEKAATVQIGNGVLSYTTNNQDASVKLALNNGVGIVNGRKVVSGVPTVFGTGASNFDLKVTNGTIRFLNQE
jgi:DUF4097 and DUF4098 domain-containing protein YvlB